MGSGIQKKMTKSALERIKGLEDSLQQTVQAVNQTLNLIDRRFAEIEEVLAAVKALNPAVENEISRARQARRDAHTEAARKALEAGVASGDIAVVEAISDKSVIVGHERNADGTDKEQARSQILFSTVKPEFQEQLRGKGIGTTITGTDGGTFEVLEVYDLVEKKEEALPSEANSADVDEALVQDIAALDEAAAAN